MKYLLILLLTGCATFDAPKLEIKRPAFTLYVTEADVPADVLGNASFYPDLNLCIIRLREYPVCLLHEIRHCIEGAWHDARPNNEDC